MESFLPKPKILPAPKFVKWGDACLSWARAAFEISSEGFASGEFVFCDFNSVEVSHKQGYILSINENGIFVKANSEVGVKNALQTLRQIALQSGEDGMRFVEIKDFPDLDVRGFMLDISRCKVPTMSELALLVDRLALFKYNRLELYTEHTYAFKGHEIVWADASPMTSAQYKNLDDICKFAGIELVANINGLGHMERWLRYPEYQHLAESKAPFICPLGTVRKYPTTFYPDENATAFMDSLYEQFLPNFSSDKINVGGDEPWELGMGRSKTFCQSHEGGKYQLYIEYMTRLNDICNKRGKQVYIWADVVMQKPEYSKLLPENITPIIWGYYLDHPYDQQCEYMQNIGRNFLVAPGTSTWNSFGLRWNCASKNIEQACDCAKKYGAEGMLLTQWGDGGNHQPWVAMYPAIAKGAGCAWGEVPSEDIVCDVLSKCVFCDETGEFARALCALGRCDVVDKLFSFHHKMFFADAENAKKLADEYSNIDLNVLEGAVDFAASMAGASKISSPDAESSLNEIALASRMIKWALNKARGDFSTSTKQQQVDLKFIASEYERVWLMRARFGGLSESVGKIRAIRADIF